MYRQSRLKRLVSPRRQIDELGKSLPDRFLSRGPDSEALGHIVSGITPQHFPSGQGITRPFREKGSNENFSNFPTPNRSLGHGKTVFQDLFIRDLQAFNH